MDVQSIDFNRWDVWSEKLCQMHRDLIVEKLASHYSSWKDELLPSFLHYDMMQYASYYAVVFSNQHVFLSPIMGVSNYLDGNRKYGYVCTHHLGVYDALYLIGKFVIDFINENVMFGSLFDDSNIIDYLDSFMNRFIAERFFDKIPDNEDENIDCLFYYGSWLTEIGFDSNGDYLTKKCEFYCEYRTPADTFHDSSEDILGFIVIPRKEMIKFLEGQGLVIS